MEKETPPPSKTGSKWWIWLIAALFVLCLALVCCTFVAAGIYYLSQASMDQVVGPEPPIVPSLPEIPTELPMITEMPVWTAEPAGEILDQYAEPLFGSVSLQRGFSPDPFAIGVEIDGTVDTSYLGFGCGFTTSEPTFAFSLGGGASETFLRIFFAASEEADPTLVLLTPDQEWLCADDSPYGSGRDPVIDLEFAPSGDYLLWVGTWTEADIIHGNLFITGSEANTP